MLLPQWGGVVGENDGLEDFPSAILVIPNRYDSSDEGKVVYNSSLVVQSTATAITNGTVDTTRIKSLTVDVPVGETPINGTITGYAPNTTQTNAWAIQKGKWVLIYARLVAREYDNYTNLFTVSGLDLPSTSRKYALTDVSGIYPGYTLSNTSITVTSGLGTTLSSTKYYYFFILLN